MPDDDRLLAVEDLRVGFGTVAAVRGVDLDLRPGECLAVVGESGSGKSATARALVGLSGGTVRARRMELAGRDLTALRDREWRAVRGGRIGLVLQDALSALDPLRTVGAEITETLANHRTVDRSARRARAVSLLGQVRVPEPEVRARQHPHELSGGLRQRALIASAIAADPPLLIADEPTTALDVTVAAQILDLLAERKAAGTAILLISHDLAVVARLADRIAVMHGGVLVEEGPPGELLRAPAHPYTRELLAAIPSAHARGTRLSVRAADGAPADGGCGYAARCPLATDRCRTEPPARVAVADGHHARCWRTDAPWPAPPARTARTRDTAAADTVIEARGLAKAFRGPDGAARPAVAGVSFTLRAGRTLGIVGESGSGKSTTAHLVMGLLEPDDGTVALLGRPWSHRPEAERRALRPRLQLVQQDPLASFDPRYTVERIIGEGLGHPGRRAARAHRDAIAALLRRVGLDAALLDRRPQELSGGQRQRVAVARALAPGPAVLVCDEPVSALDVSVQAQILDLLTDLQDDLGVALLFISHDLGVVHHMSDDVLVMRDGAVVESGPVEDVFQNPSHPYTRALLTALPSIDAGDRPVVLDGPADI
ncbi:Glutathione import ATP-binding protein GsiA [Actinomadura rubteroloni]|uniref:Glutathione import ATP-binding protein GsiA n=1 Tax=Actinomadura rubteroloni TaxID=1926885 RepID=A0A2P4UBU5_9ACTN|nr:ABC transporter ATP-binding protein [Actinomadura rubteroloni]POM22530.1 Glutathione import ATP-binding protein GsiA [Actinomadura rubteroloni]